MDYSNFEQFCGNSPFWNDSLLSDDSYPHFTECFRQVALAWIPCLAFLAGAPFYLAYLLKYDQHPPLPLSALHLVKIICSLALIVVTAVNLIVSGTYDDRDNVTDALYVSEGLKVFCFVMSIVVSCLERQKGVTTSPFLWSYWIVMVTVSVVPFYSNIIENLQDTDTFGFTQFYVYFGFLTLQFILSSFAENQSENVTHSNNPSPEVVASFPNKLSFWWLTSLIIKGYRKTLVEEDVYDLAPTDTCGAVIPPFEKAWGEEQARVDAYNKKMRSRVEAVLDKRKLSTQMIPLVNVKATGKSSSNSKDDPVKDAQSAYKCPSLLRVLVKVYAPLLLSAQLIKTIADLLTFATPKITESLLDYIANKDTERPWKGYVLATSYFVVQTLASVGSNQAILAMKRMGMKVKAAIIIAIYKKSLTISNINDEAKTGEIVNLMSVDSQKVEDVFNFMYFIVSTPVQLGLSLYMLYDQLGVAVFAGLGVMTLSFPCNAVIGHFMRKYQIKQMKLKDKRMKLVAEALSGIKVIKLYAWEESIEQKVEVIRKKELGIIKKFSYIIAAIYFIFNTMPYLVQLTSFWVYIAISDDGYLSPSTAFVSMQLFNLLNFPLSSMSVIIPIFVQAGVAITRLGKYLNNEDMKPDMIWRDPQAEYAVQIMSGEFTWQKGNEIPTLRNINLEVKQGSLVAIVGSVGCGKSSLLSAILGEMEKLKGSVIIKNSIAYVPQEAWIQNATLRNNILFGVEFNQEMYNKTIEACALTADLEILLSGDSTEIGEKGINISGGQKQRVSLARAVYSNNDIYLLDDPLSAVDSHVGKHIFQKVIGQNGVLKDKTRILVTHGIHWLPMVDTIIVMSNGTISEAGTYEDLLARNGTFAQFLKEYVQTDMNTDMENDPEIKAMRRSIFKRFEATENEDESVSLPEEEDSKLSETVVKDKFENMKESSVDEPAIALLAPAGEKLIENELGATGKVKFSIYMHYFRAIGLLLFTLSLVIYAAYTAASVFSGIWLSLWTDDELLLNTSRSGEQEYADRGNMYLGVYAASGIGQGVLILVFALIAAVKMTEAAGKLHKFMLENILRSPISFFETTPMGRIINRFSRDVDIIDNTLPGTMKQALNCLGRVLTIVIIISYGTPIFLSIAVPLCIVYIVIQVSYIPTSRQLRRLDSTTRSPILAHFSETLTGASSIRAYGVQESFIQVTKSRVDNNFKFYFASIGANTWLVFRLQFLGNLVILAAALFAVASSNIEAGMVGLSVTYAVQMTGAFEYLVTLMSDVETNIVSVERVKEYTHTTREAEWILTNHRPPSEWPQQGSVQFDSYQTRYRPGLELVLKDVSCQIQGGEKIGIVGRTGAGKSSMTVALFRLIEAAGGKIIIDGEEIASMGLHDLRSKLTILPQEPVVFSGALRTNLDPFDKCSDDQIWDALEHAHIKTFVESLPQGLSYECGEGGSNLSVGQRQLVCLARTLLRKTKILVLDEATAAVDFETDELIQKTIRSEFKDSTVLTIAHRLNTILDYDRVMVLDQGYIKEFSSPNILLSDKTSIFYGMAKDAGLV